MMISINSIIMSIILAAVAPKLDANPWLLLPTLILLIGNLVSIIYAIQAARPRIFRQAINLPANATKEFDEYLKCGRLEHGFLRVRCESCHGERLVAFSCKKRGFCPSCGARRMTERAAHLVDHVIPHVPVRQWVVSFPIPLRHLFATHPHLLSPVLQVINRAIATFLIKQAGLTHAQAQTGAVTLIQRFGSATNLNIHLHCLMLDGVYRLL